MTDEGTVSFICNSGCWVFTKDVLRVARCICRHGTSCRDAAEKKPRKEEESGSACGRGSHLSSAVLRRLHFFISCKASSMLLSVAILTFLRRRHRRQRQRFSPRVLQKMHLQRRLQRMSKQPSVGAQRMAPQQSQRRWGWPPFTVLRQCFGRLHTLEGLAGRTLAL